MLHVPLGLTLSSLFLAGTIIVHPIQGMWVNWRTSLSMFSALDRPCPVLQTYAMNPSAWYE
ncbi:hypothetical protein ARMSODRAFT_956243 [Armillaria solidipes]|uniref:Uncharacterized protein n=1 Tax=Armillaria solidipes TaxID=1076256 RepID=A0A2H3BH14_9AGAR|nr:hypothetical protein ARMSODRAFT_956243 [Armillaria solidipes]